MRKLRPTTAAIAAAVALLVSCKQPPPEPAKPRWQYMQEDFGMGRAHTPNSSCNIEIDQLLNEVRLCYNAQEADACKQLQAKNTKTINRLKNSMRCSR